MKLTPRTETEAQRVSHRALLAPGWHDARIETAVETLSTKRETPMIELTVLIPDADGTARSLRDWLTDSSRGALKIRHAAEAVGAISQYDFGEISPADFIGHAVRVKIGIEKKRGFPDRNAIEDYAAAAAEVVKLRSAT
jgi:hypothetical protein